MDRVRRFGSGVRARRKEIGLTQEQLAERARVHHNLVSLIERGKTNAGLDVVFALADALSTTAASLMTFAEGQVSDLSS